MWFHEGTDALWEPGWFTERLGHNPKAFIHLTVCIRLKLRPSCDLELLWIWKNIHKIYENCADPDPNRNQLARFWIKTAWVIAECETPQTETRLCNEIESKIGGCCTDAFLNHVDTLHTYHLIRTFSETYEETSPELTCRLSRSLSYCLFHAHTHTHLHTHKVNREEN